MASMSYCTFENGEADIRQGVEQIEEAGLDAWLLEASTSEVRAIQRLFETMQQLQYAIGNEEEFEAAIKKAKENPDCDMNHGY